MTFGGAPRRTLRRWKSSSFVTSMQSCSRASSHTAESSAPPAAICLTCSDSGNRSPKRSTSASDNGSSKSSRTASRRRNALRPTFPLGSVGQAGSNVVARQLRKLLQELFLRGAAGQIPEHIANGDTGASDTRLPESHRWVETDAIEERHTPSVGDLAQPGNSNVSFVADRPAPTCRYNPTTL